MVRISMALAALAVIAVLLPSPGMYVGLGAGIAALGWGWVGWAERGRTGSHRLWCAAAMAVGGLGLVLGGLRIALTLLAIDHLEKML